MREAEKPRLAIGCFGDVFDENPDAHYMKDRVIDENVRSKRLRGLKKGETFNEPNCCCSLGGEIDRTFYETFGHEPSLRSHSVPQNQHLIYTEISREEGYRLRTRVQEIQNHATQVS